MQNHIRRKKGKRRGVYFLRKRSKTEGQSLGARAIEHRERLTIAETDSKRLSVGEVRGKEKGEKKAKVGSDKTDRREVGKKEIKDHG